MSTTSRVTVSNIFAYNRSRLDVVSVYLIFGRWSIKNKLGTSFSFVHLSGFFLSCDVLSEGTSLSDKTWYSVRVNHRPLVYAVCLLHEILGFDTRTHYEDDRGRSNRPPNRGHSTRSVTESFRKWHNPWSTLAFNLNSIQKLIMFISTNYFTSFVI